MMLDHTLRNSKFKLIGIEKGGFKKTPTANIMVVAAGKTMTISLSELVKNRDIMDDLSNSEIESICRRHYWPEMMLTPHETKDRHENSWMVYATLTLLLFILFIVSNIAASKPVHLEYFDIVVTPGLFLYPFTFLIVDMLNECYGLRLAKRAILLAFISNGFIISLLYGTTFIPGIPGWALTTPYNEVIQQIFSVLIASSVSFLASEYINSHLLCKIKELTNSRFLFLRVFFSTLFAIVIDSFLFCFIAFSGSMESSDIINIVYIQIIVKILFALFNIFPAYGARALFRKYIIA